MLCSIITMVTSRGMAVSSSRTSRRSSIERPANGSSSSSTFGLLRQRHGDLDAPLLAIGRLRQRPVGDVVEADALERGVRLRQQVLLAVERDQRIPAQRRQAEQRQRHVAQDGVAREQRDDLIGARHAEMGALAARPAGNVAAEQQRPSRCRAQVRR